MIIDILMYFCIFSNIVFLMFHLDTMFLFPTIRNELNAGESRCRRNGQFEPNQIG